MVSETLELIIRTSGTSSAASQITGISGSARSATASVNSLNASLAFMRKTLVALSFVRVFEGVGESISKAQSINNMLMQVTKTAADVPKAFDQFQKIAIATHAPLDAVTNFGVSLIRSSASAKLSAQQIGDAVTTVFNTFRLSGNSPTQIRNVSNDLKELFSLGVVQGRQLRAILLQDQPLAILLANQLHATGTNAAAMNKELDKARAAGQRPALYELNQKYKGAITTSDITQALISGTQSTTAEAAKLPKTLSQAFTDLQTKWLGFVNTINNSGAFQPIVNFVEYLADNLPTIALGAIAVGAAFTTWLVIGQVAKLFAYMATVEGAMTAPLILLGVVGAAVFNSLAQKAGGWREFLIRLFSTLAAEVQTLFGNLGTAISAAFFGAVNGVIRAVNYLTSKLDAVLPKAMQIGQIGQFANEDATKLGSEFTKNLTNNYTFLEKTFGAAGQKGQGLPKYQTAPPPSGGGDQTKDLYKKQADALQQLENMLSRFNTPSMKFQDDIDKMSQKVKDLMKNTVDSKGNITAYGLSIKQVSDEFKKMGFDDFNAKTLTSASYEKAVAREMLGLKNATSEAGAEIAFINQQLKLHNIDQAEATKLIDDATKKRDLYNLSLLNTVDAAIATAKINTDNTDHAKRSKAGAESTATAALTAMNKTDVDTYNASLQALQKLYKDDDISAEVFAQELLKLQEGMLTGTDAMTGYQKGLLEVQKSMFDVSGTAAKAMTDAFNGLENVLVKFSMTGKFNIHDMAQSILTDLDTLAVKQAIMQPLLSFMGLAPGQNTAPGSVGGGFLGNIFGSIFGAQTGGLGGGVGGSAANPAWVSIVTSAGDIFGGLGAGGGTNSSGGALSDLLGGGNSSTASGGMFASGGLLGSGGFFDNLLSGAGGGAGSASSGILSTLGGIGSLFGFASGGSFQVGGMGGTDSQVVAFRASPDEMVSVQTPQQQQRAGQKAQNTQQLQGGVHVHLHGVQDFDSFKKSKGQVTSAIGQAISRGMKRQGA